MGAGQHVQEDQELLSHVVQTFLAKLSAPNTCWGCSGQRAAPAPWHPTAQGVGVRSSTAGPDPAQELGGHLGSGWKIFISKRG